jgi:hypothetical protein
VQENFIHEMLGEVNGTYGRSVAGDSAAAHEVRSGERPLVTPLFQAVLDLTAGIL